MRIGKMIVDLLIHEVNNKLYLLHIFDVVCSANL